MNIFVLLVALVIVILLVVFGYWWVALALVLVGAVLAAITTSKAKNRAKHEPLEWGGSRLDVVGESFHTPALAALYAKLGGAATTATLHAEKDNPHDPRAVAVRIVDGGNRVSVGHLPREVAAEIRSTVEAYEARRVQPSIMVQVQQFEHEQGVRYSVRVL